MPVTLTGRAVEESTFAIDIPFFDEEGSGVTPDSGTVTWTLTDRFANVINGRAAVPIAAAATITVVLSGNDLALPNGDSERVLTVQCTYTSDLGSNLPFKDAVHFHIQNLVGVS